MRLFLFPVAALVGMLLGVTGHALLPVPEAGGEWRADDAAGGTDPGVAHVVVLNEAGEAVRVERFHLGGSALVEGGGPAPARQEFAFALGSLRESGEITVARADGTRETVAVVLERRRPRHCRVGVWIRGDRVETSPCLGFDPAEVGAERRWDGRWVVR